MDYYNYDFVQSVLMQNSRILNAITFLVIVLLINFSSIQSSPAHNNPTDLLPSFFFDMGHPQTPVFPGFIRITALSSYNHETGYGWINQNDSSLSAIPRNLEQRLPQTDDGKPYPDDLVGDYLFWRGGRYPLQFRVDVPEGKYHVWIYLGMFDEPAKYREYAYYNISVNGITKVEANRSRDDFYRRFFHGYDIIHKPNEDIWDMYVKNQAAVLYDFDAVSSRGRLTIEFFMAAKPPGVYAALLPINALIICPAQDYQKVQGYIKKIEVLRKQQFYEKFHFKPFLERNRLPTAAQENNKKGYVVFVRNFMKKIYPNSVPLAEELSDQLSTCSAQGQRDIASFALYPFKDLQHVSITVSPLQNKEGVLLKKDSVEILRVNYEVKFYNVRSRFDATTKTYSDYFLSPSLLLKNKPVSIYKGMNQQYIVAVTPPVDAAPGDYEGFVSIEAPNVPTHKLRLRATVYPFRLETYPDDDERIWIYNSWPLLRAYGPRFLTEKEVWAWVDKDLALMKKYQIAPTALIRYTTPISDLAKFMSLYQKYGFHGRVAFSGYEISTAIDEFGIKPYSIDYQPYIRKIKEVLATAKTKNWPPFTFGFTQEIHTGIPAYLEAKRGIDIIKSAIPEANIFVMTYREEETEVFCTSKADIIGPNANVMTDEAIEMIKKAGKKLWFYGWGRNRFRCGLADWRLRNRGGFKECYTYSYRCPLNPFDGKVFDGVNDSPPLIGPEGPIATLSMEETAAGRIDFKYLATLELWLERAKKKQQGSSPARKTEKAIIEAESLLRELQERVYPDYSYYQKRLKRAIADKDNVFNVPEENIFKWKLEEYGLFRQRISHCIIALKKYLNEL